jgi:hypothetical protein
VGGLNWFFPPVGALVGMTVPIAMMVVMVILQQKLRKSEN